MGTSSSAYKLITLTRTSYYSLFCDKTRVQMFYFDSYTTRRFCHVFIYYEKEFVTVYQHMDSCPI